MSTKPTSATVSSLDQKRAEKKPLTALQKLSKLNLKRGKIVKAKDARFKGIIIGL